MISEKRLQIGLAVAWFVLIQAVLQTSGAALTALAIAPTTLRGLVGEVFYVGSIPNSLYIMTAVLALLLVFTAVWGLAAAWMQAVRLTRLVVTLWLPELRGPAQGTDETKEETAAATVGKDSLRSIGPRIWGLLQILAFVWIALIMLNVVSAVMLAFL